MFMNEFLLSLVTSSLTTIVNVTISLNTLPTSFLVNVSSSTSAAIALDATPLGSLTTQVEQTCARLAFDAEECTQLLEYTTQRAQIMAGRSGVALSNSERERYFSNVYRWNVWGAAAEAGGSASSSSSSRSGAGSSRTSAARAIAALETILDRYPATRSLLDVPCGDLTWMPLDLLRRRGIAYVGADIVPQIVEDNRRRYADHKGDAAAAASTNIHTTDDVASTTAARTSSPPAQFRVMDVVTSPIPPTVDAIFMRDLFYHMTTHDVLRVLRNVEASNATLFIAKTALRANQNWDDFILAFGHQVNLFERPFCLRDPSLLIRDYDGIYLFYCSCMSKYFTILMIFIIEFIKMSPPTFFRGYLFRSVGTEAV